MSNKPMSSFKDLEGLKVNSNTKPVDDIQIEQIKRKGSNDFALTLNRKLEVKRYPVIAQFTFKRKRKDLVSLLKAIQQSPEGMPKRLVAYLQRELLWDHDRGELTSKGKEVADTGFFDEKEQGLYHIWYTDGDELLGTRPLFLQRDTAFFDPNISSSSRTWKKGSDARTAGFEVTTTCYVDSLEGSYSSQGSSQSQERLALVSLQPEVLCSSEASTSLDLEWRIGLKKSVVSLKGKLDALDFSQNKKALTSCDFELDIEGYQGHLNELLCEVSGQFNGRWDESAKRVAVELRELGNNKQVVQSFEVVDYAYKHQRNKFGVFDSFQVSHLPVKPVNGNDALRWHELWLNNFHSEAYQSSTESRQQQSLWLDHKAITEFNLPLKSGQELLGCFKREEQTKPHWHVAAMMDLSPSRSQKQVLPIMLMNNDTLDIAELIDQLTFSTPIKHMIYSDRYVYTSRQRRNLGNVARYMGNTEGLLMTLIHRGKSHADLPANWEHHFFEKESNNHGRYWLFISDSHSYYWECTSGIDFIKGETSDFTVDGTPSFIPKEEAELPQYLQETIKKIKAKEVI